ncbi:hypothetical protein BJ322DRAFT_1114803 [Thelephora terrestris]|uniref:Uncharacterized protein n=1 Tax=Thelephora terrestris TaxID=56493 RepID=A0A9P6H2V8_9AGAM|nr:hypothetical protein BJ322DRAFT_1114803 [Thelephora terrestris]
MSLRRSVKKLAPAPESGPAAGGAVARLPSKSKEQVDYLVTHYQDFLTHQTAVTLDRFWPRVYEGWYKRWPITPAPGATKGSAGDARTENNQKLRSWFHNRACPTSKASKSDLRLDQTEKRKLAPAQAYCTYAWNSGLSKIVSARWERERQSRPSAAGSGSAVAAANSSIPIDFKLKIAKEVYDALPADEKKKIDDCRDKEWKKLYRPIRDIENVEDRDEKLAMHEQPAVLLISSLDLLIHETERCLFKRGGEDLKFRTFCGSDWDDVIEKRFTEWGMKIFGEPGAGGRSKYMFTNTPPEVGDPETIEGSDEASPSTSTALVGELEVIETSDIAITPLPKGVEAMESVPLETSTAFPVDSRPLTTGPQAPSDGLRSPAPPQICGAIKSVPPREISGTDESNGLTASNAVVSPAQIPSSIPASVLVSPVLDSTHALTSRRSIAVPVVLEPPYVAPSQVSQVVPSNQATVFAMAPEITHLVSPSDVLGPPQSNFPHQVTNSHMVHSLSTINPPPATQVPKNVGVQPTEGVASGNSEVAVVRGAYKTRDRTEATRLRHDSIEGAPGIILRLAGSGYEVSTQPDDSCLATSSGLPAASSGFPTTPSTTPSPATYSATTPSPATYSATTSCCTTVSSTTPLDEFLVPSSQQSLEEVLTIPTAANTTFPRTSPNFELVTPSSKQSPEESLDIIRSLSLFAPRIIPSYKIERSDLPSWLTESGRLDYILSVESGGLWEKLIITWLRQERRIGFGLDENMGANLSLTNKPQIIKEYFKWRHHPSKGDSIVLPEFGEEVSLWWMSMQPSWRYKDETSPDNHNDYSYMLAGGKKGVFLLILCLAWWDRAWGKKLEKTKAERQAVSKDANTSDYGTLPHHDTAWFNILNDLIFVLELAQGWPVPIKGVSGTAGVVPGRRKRPAEATKSPSRKRSKQA